jgi:D-alanyl-D-alanine carboxypeptidase
LKRKPSNSFTKQTIDLKRRTITILRIVMPTVAFASLIYFVPWMLVKAWLTPLPSSIQDQLDHAVSLGMDGIIVDVDQAGKPPVTYTAGFNNREMASPAQAGDLFKIASIGKLYVAVAFTKLAASGSISLDATLAATFPELADRIDYADEITLRMMVQHRSGIPNLTDHPDYPWTQPPKSAEEALNYALDLPAAFRPDADYAYSNTNFLLIAEAMDRVLGYSHQDYIQTQILGPLNLTETFANMHEVPEERIMCGYAVGWPYDIKGNDFGSMVASVADVGKFIRALNTGGLLNTEERALYEILYTFEHTGLVPGYQSIARYIPEHGAVVIQFNNTSGGNMWSLAEINYKRVIQLLRNSSI